MTERITIWAIACFLSTSLTAWAQPLEYRYWRALNAGRDVSELAPELEQLAFPPLRKDSVEAIRRAASEKLDRIEASAPLEPVVADQPDRHAAAAGDWPSMGGGVAHAGATSDAGPVAGHEAWRYAVGWSWEASPRIEPGRVLTASPAWGQVARCLDRATGRPIWTSQTRTTGFGRRHRAASSLIPLGGDDFAVFQESFEGWPLSFLIVNRGDGQVARRVPATMQETKVLSPESEPKQLVAFRIAKGTQVLVKSLLTGRTWWRFPTGYLPDKPLLAWGHVFGAAEDGTLWALNLWGARRVAWTYSNHAGWGATPAEQHGVLYAGGNDGAIYAFDTSTGAVRWKTQVAESVMPHARRFFSTPLIAGNRLYAGAADGFLYSLETSTGQLRWKHDCGDWIRSRPCAAGDSVCAATLDGRLVAVRDAPTRAVPLWTTSPGRFPIYADLACDGDGVAVSTSDFDLVAYDWQDGREQWRNSLIDCYRDRKRNLKICCDSMPEIMQAPVIVADRMVLFAGRNGFVTAADATTGKRRWRFECGGRVSAAPTTHGGRVFVGQVGGNQVFYALALETGRPLWSRQLRGIWASPECDDRQLFVGNKDGTLYCLDPATGNTIWQRQFADGVYPAPALDADRVYTGSWDGHYYALDRTNGRIVWAFSRPGHTYHISSRPDSAAPVLADNRVLVPILGGRFVALEARTGKVLWEWKGTPWRICNVTGATDGKTVFVSQFGNAYEFPFEVALFGLDIGTGNQLWKVPNVGGLTSPVITTGNRFVIGSMGRPFLYGYQLGDRRTDTPRLLWRLRTGGVMYESLPAVSGDLAYFLSNDGWLRAIE